MLKNVSLYSPDAARGWIPWALLAPVLGALFVVGPMVVGVIVITLAGLATPAGHLDERWDLAATLVVPFTLVLATVLAWVWLVERRSLASIGLVRGRAPRRFLLGLAIGWAAICVVVATIRATGAYATGAWWPAFADTDALVSIVLLAPCFALQSSVEEIVTRGWLLSTMARRSNVALAVIASSLVFSLLHGLDQAPLVMLNTFVFGVFAAAWALWAGHIWGVMGWHAGWNWLLCTGFELPVTGVDAGLPALLVRLVPRGETFWTGGDIGPEGSIVCTLFFGAAAACLFVARARRDARADGQGAAERPR